MKKIFTLLAAVMTTVMATAQNFTILQDGKAVADGATVISCNVDANAALFGVLKIDPEIKFVNNTAAPLTLVARMTAVDNAAGAGICCGGQCETISEEKTVIEKTATLTANETLDPRVDFNKFTSETTTAKVTLKVWEQGKEEQAITFTLIMSNDKNVGIHDVQQSHSINVSGNTLHYSFNQAAQRTISIYSLTGKRLMQKAAPQANGSVSLAGLPKGVYLYKVSGQPAYCGKFNIR